MNPGPLVSIITPAFNAESYIQESIQSILNQTYQNFEYIILDDASTDNTWNMVQEFAKNDKRIKAFRNDKNLYIAGNRNKGISLALGKYVVWQDADDISDLTRVEKLVSFMEEHLEVGICGSYLQSFSGSKKLDIRKYATTDKDLRRTIFRFSPVAQPSAIIRRECFDKVGLYNLESPPAEDIDMSFRIGTLYKFANIPEVLLDYREHENSATYTKLRKILAATLEARKKYLGKSTYYTASAADYFAYVLTWVVQYLPSKIVVYLFKSARNIVRLFNI